MSDLAVRFSSNPIIRPSDVIPSRPDMEVTCVLNPGAFRFQGRIGLLIRVAERPVQESGWVSTPVLNPTQPGGIEIIRYRIADCDDASDARVFTYQGKEYLTTLSHLRLAWSDDGVKFIIDPTPTLIGEGPWESFGVEDSRVTQIGDTYHLHFTAVSDAGFGVGYISTKDWKSFERHGVIIPPPNKDFALFPEMIGDYYYALHRPTHSSLGGPYIWISRSPDLLHWGDHHCVARPRLGLWDGQKIGGGAEPIKTNKGWLEIYHGVAKDSQYCLGLLLFDLNDPRKLLARSELPIMKPTTSYELTGFYGNVIFTNGHVVNGDNITLYYGASDEVICGATLSIQALLASLNT